MPLKQRTYLSQGQFRIHWFGFNEARLPALLQSGLPHAVEEFRHRARHIRHIFFDPGNRNFGLQLLEPCELRARLGKLTRLR